MRTREHKRVYSRECTISHSPGYRTQEPIFYRCSVCGTVVVRISPLDVASTDSQGGGHCCDQPMERLEICPDTSPDAAHGMRFCIFGGFANNTIRIEVDGGNHPMGEDHCIEWIYLRTFQGGQMKVLPKKKDSAALFAMAEEDAYAFCDREICRMGWETCHFQCKRGHIAYAYCNVHGLKRLEF
ncbi:MAG: desulfoferrodoxin family protein [Christensenella sp.]|uniref:desulfoferrodoxin family protein n=1 Tax=Christensenella sp. TaxID=1935934 RepID=UPI002B21D73B|nr:desulfoferrodoxin family protein [Christensenella sp.]MEA5002509.1 desulfoferrodoxin family protein [Christensenella sp.]